jgi:hypothetical protein
MQIPLPILSAFNDSANAIDITKIVKRNILEAFGYEAEEREKRRLASQTGTTMQGWSTQGPASYVE